MTSLSSNEGKDIPMFHVPRSSVRPGQPYLHETVSIKIRTMFSPFNIGRKTLRENHWALIVNGERYPIYVERIYVERSRTAHCSGQEFIY